jgi:hypothetical protein
VAKKKEDIPPTGCAACCPPVGLKDKDNTLTTPFLNWTVTCTAAPSNGVVKGDGYKDFMVALRNHVRDFKRPVTYVHGDSHTFL